MKLSVLDRLLLFNALPAEGDIITVRTVRTLREGLGFSDEETAAFGITREGDQITWDEPKSQDKEIEIPPRAFQLIVDTLERMNREKRLTERHILLYDKMLGGEAR